MLESALLHAEGGLAAMAAVRIAIPGSVGLDNVLDLGPPVHELRLAMEADGVVDGAGLLTLKITYVMINRFFGPLPACQL